MTRGRKITSSDSNSMPKRRGDPPDHRNSNGESNATVKRRGGVPIAVAIAAMTMLVGPFITLVSAVCYGLHLKKSSGQPSNENRVSQYIRLFLWVTPTLYALLIIMLRNWSPQIFLWWVEISKLFFLKANVGDEIYRHGNNNLTYIASANANYFSLTFAVTFSLYNSVKYLRRFAVGKIAPIKPTKEYALALFLCMTLLIIGMYLLYFNAHPRTSQMCGTALCEINISVAHDAIIIFSDFAIAFVAIICTAMRNRMKQRITRKVDDGRPTA